MPNGVLTTKTSSTIVGPVTLYNTGSFTVTVQNGSGGATSNGVGLTVNAASPSISSISPSPNPPIAGQQFTLTINGSNFDPSSAQILITGTLCTPCTVPNGVLTTKTASTIVGPVTLNNSGSFTVTVQNGSGGATSNGVGLTVNAASPSISSISPSPNPPIATQQFTLTINGSNFDPSSAQILITGTLCTPCTVPNGVLTTKTASTIVGPVTLNNSGSFTVTVQNGSGGAISNGLSLTVASGPSITSISSNPNPPIATQQFTLTINGSNFDPSSAQILITGTLCTPCTVPNGVLTTKTASTIVGPVTLNNSGSFTVTVQNGSGGAISNGLSLTVASGPSITSISSNPNPPIATQQFTLTINGSNFDPSSAQILITGTLCTPCTVPNGVLTTKTASTIVGPVTLNNSGSFTVTVQNGSGGAISNGLSLTVASGPSITSISSNPNPPIATQQFTLTINGSNFDPSSAQILITGTLCTPCTVPNGVLTTKTSGTIVGPVTLNNSGSFTVTVQNGSGGAISNGLSLTVGAGPSITSISSNPNPPIATQQFTLTINGSNFDPSSAQILITGTLCTPCTVPNGVLTTKTSGTIVGPVTLNNSGSFTVTVQNGSGGAISNGLSLTVGAGPSITSISSNPNPPVQGQQFTLTINGSSFDPSSAQILITGTLCTPCTVPNGVLTTKTASTIVGPVTLNNSGSFTVTVQNGSGGATSNGVSLTVGAGPSITSISSNPNPPVQGQQFTLTINGSSFDPSSAQILITGTLCTPCTVPNGVLTTKTASTIVGPVTLNNSGSFTVTVQNGSGGATSNGVSLTVGSGPSITSISSNPNPPVQGQQFTLTINGSSFDPSSAQILITGTLCTPCTVPNGVLTTKTASTIVGPVTLNNSGSFTVTVQNGSGGATSNGVSLTVGSGPSITSISSNPNPPVQGQQFTLTINGSNFDPSSAQIVITGTLCTPCTVPNGVLTTKTASTIVGPVTLNNSGSFTVTVQNGSGGATSNGVSLTVGTPSITITSISSNPNPPVQGQQFTLTINGSNFDPSSAQILITGTLCTPCTVPNGVLTTKTASTIVGPVTLNNSGSFTVTVQNGSGGATSNGVSLTVGTPSITITSISSNPNPPVQGQQFTLTINGSNFDPSSAQILITGTLCTPCTVPNGVLTTKTASTIVGPVTLNNSGSFTVTVQNGSGGATSNGVSLTVGTPSITITSISSNPNPPVQGQQFTLTINGSNFDPSSAQILITGTLCTPCTVPNGVLTTKTASTIVGPVTLNNSGSFTVTVQNGSGGATSNGVSLTVGTPSITITSISSNPNPPVQGQQFTLTINGSNFDPSSAQIVITGTLCTPCTVPNGVLTTKTASTIVGPVTLNNSGSFTVTVQNGSGGATSNGLSLTVNAPGPSAGTLTASPSTCQVTPPATTCTISLLWTLQNVKTAQIFATDALNNETPVTTVTVASGSMNIPWIQALPQKYTFRLWDYSSGSRGTQLASVSVSATTASGANSSVGVNPSTDTPGKTFTILGSGFAAGQATVYVQPPGASAAAVGQVNAASDGSFSFQYNTSSLSATGLYTAWAIGSTGTKSSSGTFTIYKPNPASIPNCQSNTTTSGCNGDPINTGTGNYTYQRTDLTIPGRGLPFVFTRTYNSQDGTPGPMGAGWTHSYMASFVQNPDGSVTIRTPDGQVVIFDPTAGAYVSRYGYVHSTLQSPSSGTFILTTQSQISYRFTGNQLVSVSDRNGNTIQLTYSGSNLTTITDTAGRQISLSYNVGGHITTLADPIGRTLQYGYDGAGNLITFIDARGGTFTYTYDGAHQMLTGLDPANNTFLTNTYDSFGHVISQADGVGNRWTYSYDSNTLITTITDPNGTVSSHLHDSKFELLRATDTFGKNDQYQYDSAGNRISVQDRNGNTSSFAYDTNGNVIAATDPQSKVQAAAYDAQSNPLSRTDAMGNQTTFSYDGKGNLVGSIDAAGNQTTFGYNSYGQLLSKTDALGRVTQYTYDGSGNLTQVVDPTGAKTSYSYDAVGRRTSVTDANGFTTSTVYDANDNVVSVTDPLNNKTQYNYDGNNNRVKVTDPRGKATSYSYDGNNKPLTTTDALGNKMTSAYDKLRNPASVTDQLGNATRYAYDSENRLASVTDPLGNASTYTYDSAGNRTQATDPLGNVTTYMYDSLNHLVSAKDALGNTATTAYDAAGRVIQKTDQAGDSTTYAYDATGRQTTIQDAAGGVVSFQNDKVGNRTQITDTRGKVTKFTYDGMNRVLTITDPLGNVTSNQYDAAGNLVQVTDGNGNTKSYQYDGDARQTKVTYSTGGSIQFTYDANGNRTQMVDLVGTSTYAYDDLNRLQSYTSPVGATLSFSYDAASDRTAIQYPGSKSVQYTFDANRRISNVRDWNSFSAAYSYDAIGRPTGVSYSNSLASQYTFDAVGQNTRIQHSNGGTILYSEATTWSANGNPTSSDISGLTSTGLPSENTAYAYNDASELGNSTYGTPISDKNGNLKVQPGFGGPTNFSYDLNNRTTGITGPSINATMKYFGDGKLAELDSASSSHRYLVDPTVSGNRILTELDANGAMQIAYVYGPRGMLSQISGGQTYVYLHNLQGSTAALVDSGGTVKNSYRYDPFGQKLPSSTENVSNLFAFLSSFSVVSVGQYSITTHRLYDSRQGRFSSADPAYYAASAISSPFTYANQSPIVMIDPSGLIAQALSPAVVSIGLTTPAWILSSTQAAIGSTANPCPNPNAPTDVQVSCGLNLAGIGLSAVSALGPSYHLVAIPGQAGAFKIVNSTAAVDAAGNILSVPSLAISAYQDSRNPNLSAGLKVGRTSANLLLGLNPFVAVPYGAASIMFPNKPTLR